MEITIKLPMGQDKSLKIYVNDKEKQIIEAQSRSISAEKIYEIVDFTTGNHYTVVSENEGNVDVQVLKFFSDLFTEIADKINSFKVEDTQ